MECKEDQPVALDESDVLSKEGSSPSTKAAEEWTREEDKVILQVFEQGGTANILEEVTDLLPKRTPEQVNFIKL